VVSKTLIFIAPTETVGMITANPSGLLEGGIARAADEDLIELLRAGSDEALTVLFDRYHRLVFHVALRIVRDPGEAEDVVQTVFQHLPSSD
jgi:Sigma-70 region 2